ncbi:hypothetical protein [Clostridium perfringens]|nr:hypothetical protein [Clostridium perfringens]MDM0997383.1 hypothetical protein [Clostridium perfringens]MDU3844369.1 hypothetical protein [Clostridium perfringens]WVM76769.1 hypothetical protein V1680_04220 [Clostridium perfringens]
MDSLLDIKIFFNLLSQNYFEIDYIIKFNKDIDLISKYGFVLGRS